MLVLVEAVFLGTLANPCTITFHPLHVNILILVYVHASLIKSLL